MTSALIKISPVEHWAWPLWLECASLKGAAALMKTLAWGRPLPLHMRLVTILV